MIGDYAEAELRQHFWRQLEEEGKYDPLTRPGVYKVGVYFDTHPNERRQKKVGRYLQANRPAGVRVIENNTLASITNRRYTFRNFNTLPEGRLLAHPREENELNLAARREVEIDYFNMPYVFDLHDTPIPGDSSVWIHKRAGGHVRRVATYLRDVWDMPIIIAPPTTFSGRHPTVMTMEMEVGHPRFEPEAFHLFVMALTAGRLALPETVAPPDFTIVRDLVVSECVRAGLTPNIAPFGPIPDEAAAQLGLHTPAFVSNWVFGSIPEAPSAAGIALTTCPEAADMYGALLPGHVCPSG